MKRLAAAVIAIAMPVAIGIASYYEGSVTRNGLHVAYKDSGGVWTICEGHTKGVKKGDTATEDQCNAWLKEDMQLALETIDRCITYPLTSNQLGAFLDAVFNLGPKVVCGSTLQRKANAGDIKGACYELTQAANSDGGRRGWSFDNGVFLPGLYKRRMAELAICWPDFSKVSAGSSSTANPTQR